MVGNQTDKLIQAWPWSWFTNCVLWPAADVPFRSDEEPLLWFWGEFCTRVFAWFGVGMWLYHCSRVALGFCVVFDPFFFCREAKWTLVQEVTPTRWTTSSNALYLSDHKDYFTCLKVQRESMVSPSALWYGLWISRRTACNFERQQFIHQWLSLIGQNVVRETCPILWKLKVYPPLQLTSSLVPSFLCRHVPFEGQSPERAAHIFKPHKGTDSSR